MTSDDSTITLGTMAILNEMKDKFEAEVSKAFNIMMYGDVNDEKPWVYKGGIIPND